MNSAKFKLLMWKNYRLRRYHWVVTLIEFALPIFITYAMVKLNANVAKPLEKDVNETSAIAKEDFLSPRPVLNGNLFFAPANPAVQKFIDRIRDRFDTVIEFADKTELENAMQNVSCFGIFFKNIPSTETLPDILSYELRHSDGEANTRSLYTADYSYIVQSYREEPYFKKHFSGIQLLINEEFIKLKTSESLGQLEFGYFPLPEYIHTIQNASFRSVFTFAFIALVLMVVFTVSIPLISDIIEEKESGVKELMKISGLDEWMMWLAWFVHGLTVCLPSFTIIAIILTHPVFNEAGDETIRCVQFSILWAFFMLYCIANVSICFLASSIFHKTTIASTVCVLVFYILLGTFFWLVKNAADHPLLKLITVIPLGAFILGFNKINSYETLGIEYTWTSAGSPEGFENNSVSLMFCMFMLVFDTFSYSFLAYYISCINPGKFGARKSPLFIFQMLDFRKNKLSNDLERPLLLKNLNDKVDSKFMESPPANVEATIQIEDLHKQYGSVHAAKGVNLNIYQGELTALLGHNGAGKTTTMSMMTGLTSPNAGTIYYKNMNIFKNMQSFRQHLGMCPQENRTIPYLTVLEHLIFFGQLRGVSRDAAEVEANEYLKLMELLPKRDSLVKELSGGMKRKLCLSIALMGKAEVLILDEPTSGMDVQSRRKIWDLFLDMRGKRTIIFTTHHMEEADALGDRIAIMNHGVIVCHGTAIFLKKAYNTGYKLTITKSIQYSNGIDQALKNILPNAIREFESAEEVVYTLPLTETDKFPALFKNLESEKFQSSIKQVGVAATTMEDVFLKVGGFSINDTESVESVKNTTVTDSILESDIHRHIIGFPLLVQQISALLKKKLMYTTRNWFILFERIFLPILLGIFLLGMLRVSSNVTKSQGPPLDLSLSTYPGSIVVLRDNVGSSNFAKYFTEYVNEKGGSLVNADDTTIEQDLLKRASDISKYNKDFISAFELNSTKIKLLSNPSSLHSVPITITTYSNVLLRSLTNSTKYGIETINYPVKNYLISSSDCPSKVTNYAFYFLFFFLVAFYCIELTSYLASFVIIERIDGFQHVQLMSKVSPAVYWFGTLIFDLAFFLMITGFRIGMFQLSYPSDFLGWDASFGVFALISFLYGISDLLFKYVFGYLIWSKERSYTIFLILNLIGTVVVCIFCVVEMFLNYRIFEMKSLDSPPVIFKAVEVVIMLIPFFNFTSLFIKLILIYFGKIQCVDCSGALTGKPTCEAKSYLVFASKDNHYGLLQGVYFLLFDIVLYSAILTIINTGYCRQWYNSLKNAIYGSDVTIKDVGDEDVQKEYRQVQQYRKDKLKKKQVALLVDGLRKNYISWFKPSTAVSDASFVVEPGECFGLLGVNGAGKSTTFKMLTTEIVPTLGDASIEGIDLNTDKMQYLSMAGYCPQTNCFIEELTGREMLSMIAAMRGVRKRGNRALVDKWINIIGLEEYQNRKCGTYSGGNKRKLCTAISLIGDPRVVFLDEPTSGVDPVSRRNLYDVMKQSKETGQSVILTSHSMEECETLCNRLTIMVSGVMKCIGTTQHLKKCYAQGFLILIKIKNLANSATEDQITALKQTMMQAFTPKYCSLKDEHRGSLYYQIKDTTLSWSVLFERMELLKNQHQELVQDYVLTDTTLEEVFIWFAKQSSNSTR